MYTLLLVDDEEEVIEAIVKKVKWEERLSGCRACKQRI